MRRYAFVLSLITLMVTCHALALPPAGSKPLSEVAASVEAMGLGVITSAEFDDGLWEIKVRKDDATIKLYIDPRTGEERRRKADDHDDERPPAGAKPLSEILEKLEAEDVGTIYDVEIDDKLWEIEARKDGSKRKYKIDPMTGQRVR